MIGRSPGPRGAGWVEGARAGGHTGPMDLTASVVAPCAPTDLFAWVDDLARYPEWLEIVARADPLPGGEEPEDRPAWAVDLRGRLGPLARTKRLRMVRSRHRAPDAVRFERSELDGRDHSPWVLEAEVHEHPEGSELRMHLHYGGGLFGPVLEHVLRDEIEQSRQRLVALVR